MNPLSFGQAGFFVPGKVSMSSAPEKSIVPPRRGRARARTGARDVLDRIDRQILKRLQENGRLSISQIASEVHLTVAPCCERVRRLEAAGYITGYFAQLDPQRLGLGLLAYVVVDIDRTAPEVFS